LLVTAGRLGLSAVVICCLSGALGAAQSRPAGKLSGLVIDTSENVMPGVSIGLRGPEARTTVTDKDGRFAFASLTAGDYELWARLAGFETSVEKVTVTEKTEPVRIRMRVGRGRGDVETIFIGDPPSSTNR
jgi:hypothetical protein